MPNNFLPATKEFIASLGLDPEGPYNQIYPEYGRPIYEMAISFAREDIAVDIISKSLDEPDLTKCYSLKDDWTVAEYAICYNMPNLFRLILTVEAFRNHRDKLGYSLAHNVVYRKNLELLEIMRENGLIDLRSLTRQGKKDLLDVALVRMNFDVILKLIEYGFDINHHYGEEKSRIEYFAKSIKKDIEEDELGAFAERLVELGFAKSPENISKAIYYNGRLYNFFVDLGFSETDYNYNPLRFLIDKNEYKFFEEIIDDFSLEYKSQKFITEYQENLLYYCIRKGKSEFAKLIFEKVYKEKGLDLGFAEYNANPIGYSLMYGHVELAKYFIEQGLDTSKLYHKTEQNLLQIACNKENIESGSFTKILKLFQEKEIKYDTVDSVGNNIWHTYIKALREVDLSSDESKSDVIKAIDILAEEYGGVFHRLNSKNEHPYNLSFKYGLETVLISIFAHFPEMYSREYFSEVRKYFPGVFAAIKIDGEMVEGVSISLDGKPEFDLLPGDESTDDTICDASSFSIRTDGSPSSSAASSSAESSGGLIGCLVLD